MSLKRFTSILVLALVPVMSAKAALINSGTAVIDFDNAVYESTFGLTVDNFFGGTEGETFSISQMLNAPAPVPALDPTGLVYEILDGSVTSPSSGRAPQATTLDFDFANFNPANPLASWSKSLIPGPPPTFPPTGGEQIGLNGTARYTSLFGDILIGDFAIRNTNGRTNAGASGLVLVSNISFPAVAYDIANIDVVASADILTITGDLLISPEFANGFFGGFGNGLDVGNITITAVPEASSVAMAFTAILGFAGFRYRKSRTRSEG